MVGSFSKIWIFTRIPMKFSIPLATRSKKWDCDLWLGGILGWIPTEGIDYLSIMSVVSGQAEIFELTWSERSYRFSCVWVSVAAPWKHFPEILNNKSMWRTEIENIAGLLLASVFRKIIVNFLWKNDVTLFIRNLANYISHILCAKRDLEKWKHRLLCVF